MVLPFVVGVGLCFYGIAAALALLFARTALPPEAAAADARLSRYHAMLSSYAAGRRLYMLAAAVAAYGAAALALFAHQAQALWWLCFALALDCSAFFLWPQRRAFIGDLSPDERMGDAAGVAALTMALLLTAYLRFSGALA